MLRLLVHHSCKFKRCQTHSLSINVVFSSRKLIVQQKLKDSWENCSDIRFSAFFPLPKNVCVLKRLKFIFQNINFGYLQSDSSSTYTWTLFNWVSWFYFESSSSIEVKNISTRLVSSVWGSIVWEYCSFATWILISVFVLFDFFIFCLVRFFPDHNCWWILGFLSRNEIFEIFPEALKSALNVASRLRA